VAVCGRSLAIGTIDGQIMVLHFPHSLWRPSGIRAVVEEHVDLL
jgi:hypothetical protein